MAGQERLAASKSRIVSATYLDVSQISMVGGQVREFAYAPNN